MGASRKSPNDAPWETLSLRLSRLISAPLRTLVRAPAGYLHHSWQLTCHGHTRKTHRHLHWPPLCPPCLCEISPRVILAPSWTRMTQNVLLKSQHQLFRDLILQLSIPTTKPCLTRQIFSRQIPKNPQFICRCTSNIKTPVWMAKKVEKRDSL